MLFFFFFFYLSVGIDYLLGRNVEIDCDKYLAKNNLWQKFQVIQDNIVRRIQKRVQVCLREREREKVREFGDGGVRWPDREV